MGGILSVEGKLTPDKAQAIKDSLALAFDVTTGTPGGIAVMEKGLTFIPVSISAADSQLLETRGFNVTEIARFFGVSPTKLFDQSNLTYSNVEALSLGFITDTIAPLDAKIENEFNRKLFRPSERLKTRLNLSIKELILNNADSKSNYLSKMFATGGYTVNEIRAELGLENFDHENADKPMAQVNMQTIDKFGQNPKVVAPPKVEQPPVDNSKVNQ
jgi:HK97 family phage portal protein